MSLNDFSPTVKMSSSKISYSLAPVPVRIPELSQSKKGRKSHCTQTLRDARIATVAVHQSRKSSSEKSQDRTRDTNMIKDEKTGTYVSLEECIQSRPPLKLDLSGPNPTSYDPPKMLPWETKSPAFTMRPKTHPEKDGGGDRVSWEKQWFASPHIWTLRAKFDVREPWPSPACYQAASTIGLKQSILPQSPSHSFGKRNALILNKVGSENEPSPNQYNYDRSKQRILTKYPSYTIQQGRRGGTAPWSAKEPVPGPGTYTPKLYVTSCKKVSPAYSWPRSERKIGISMNCTL